MTATKSDAIKTSQPQPSEQDYEVLQVVRCWSARNIKVSLVTKALFTQDAQVQICLQILWCFLHSLWTLATTGSMHCIICILCERGLGCRYTRAHTLVSLRASVQKFSAAFLIGRDWSWRPCVMGPACILQMVWSCIWVLNLLFCPLCWVEQVQRSLGWCQWQKDDPLWTLE